MPMSVVYTTVNGRLVEENRGGVVTRYIPDTLGNVIKTTDVNGNITSETTYWPFGEVRTQVGTNPSPWGFCGIWGYLQDAAARLYVRARYLRTDFGRWLTVDPLWPGEAAYGYADGRPSDQIDYTGNIAVAIGGGALVGAGMIGSAGVAISALLLKLLAILAVVALVVLLAYLIALMQQLILDALYRWRECACSYLIGNVHPICDKKRTCKQQTPKLTCSLIMQRLLRSLMCLIIRRLTEPPFCAIRDPRHKVGTWKQEIASIKNCLEALKKNCAPRIPRIVMPW